MQHNYEDSEDLYNECKYQMAKNYIEQKLYDAALNELDGLDYKDSKELTDSILNGKSSINQFINRYNAMVDILKNKVGVTIAKLDVSKFNNNEIIAGTSSKILFNQSEETNAKYEIISCMWRQSPWIMKNDEELLGEIYCCIAGFSDSNDYDLIGKVVGELLNEGSELYSSTQYNGLSYTLSRSKKEMTLGIRPAQ